MEVPLLVLGSVLVLVTIADALWTVLWIDGYAGPVTRRHAILQYGVLRRLLARSHFALSTVGPIILVNSVLIWIALLWSGWAILFSAAPDALRHAHDGSAATVVERIYYTGYAMFTLGNGDFVPVGALWQLATSVAALSGFALVGLVATYVLTVLQAVVQMRSFASQVTALGDSADSLVVGAWDGGGFPSLDLQIVSLTEQLNMVGERHVAYPLLHFFHAQQAVQSVPFALAIFDDALTLLGAAVVPEHRPGRAALRCAAESVHRFLLTIRDTHAGEPDGEAPALTGRALREAGIPLVAGDAFAAHVAQLRARRRLLLGFLDAEHRPWPPGSDDGRNAA